MGRIQGVFLKLHNDKLFEKGLIPAIDAVQDDKNPSKNKYDIFLDEKYEEDIADAKEKYYSG